MSETNQPAFHPDPCWNCGGRVLNHPVGENGNFIYWCHNCGLRPKKEEDHDILYYGSRGDAHDDDEWGDDVRWFTVFVVILLAAVGVILSIGALAIVFFL